MPPRLRRSPDAVRQSVHGTAGGIVVGSPLRCNEIAETLQPKLPSADQPALLAFISIPDKVWIQQGADDGRLDIPACYRGPEDFGMWLRKPSQGSGRETNFGVTQAVYDEYRASRGLPKRSVKLITEAEVAEIYQTRYNELPAGIDYATFDAAVNRACLVARNGCRRHCASARTSFVSGLVTFKVFGRGWLSRIARVEAKSVKMAMEKRGTSAASQNVAFDIESDVASKNAKSAATTSKVSGAGAGGSAYQVDWSNITRCQSAS